jgi:VCBS repeat-containing protein
VTSGSVIEAGGVANGTAGTPTATGTLTSTDVDNPANTFTAVATATNSTNGYGTYTMTAGGVWTYALNNNNATVQALNVGGTLTDTFTVTSIDGASQVVTVTINGSNDAAVISGSTTGSVIEAGGVANGTAGTPTATGTLTSTDVDNPATFTTVGTATNSTYGYGTYTMTSGGVWTYALNNNNAAVQALNAGATMTDTFTVTSIDGTARVVTVTITGSNDNATISGTSTGNVAEDGTQTASGTLAVADVDAGQTVFQTPSSLAGTYGTYTFNATTGVWGYTLNNGAATVHALAGGQQVTDTLTVTSLDGTATRNIVVTITGQNDAAVISGATSGSVIEAGGVANGTAGTPTATGTLTSTDIDNPANTFTAVATATNSTNGYGTYTMTAGGVWTYALNNNNATVQALNVGGTLTDTFTVTSIDGTSQVVTVTINGRNDAAVISGSTSGSVIEAGGVANGTAGTPTATGTLTSTDVDNPATFTAVGTATNSTNGYGTYTMTSGGVWT